MGHRLTAVRPAPPRRRRPFRLLASVVLVSLLATLLGSAPGGASAADPTAPPATAFARGVPPKAGEDFPRMPQGCYESDRVTLLVAPCRITRYGAKRPTLVVWGDSHAWMYLPALRREARSHRVNLTLVVLGSCPVALPLPSASGFGRSRCENYNRETVRYLKQLKRRKGDQLGVLVGGFWSGYRDAYRRQRQADRAGTDSGLSDYQRHMSTLAVTRAPAMFDRLGRLGLDIDLIGQAATVPLDARACSAGQEPYQCGLPRSRALSREQGNRRWIKRNLRQPLAGSPRLIDTTPGYCSARRCRAQVGGVNTYYDSIHLGARLTRRLTDYFTPVFDDLT